MAFSINSTALQIRKRISLCSAKRTGSGGRALAQLEKVKTPQASVEWLEGFCAVTAQDIAGLAPQTDLQILEFSWLPAAALLCDSLAL